MVKEQENPIVSLELSRRWLHLLIRRYLTASVKFSICSICGRQSSITLNWLGPIRVKTSARRKLSSPYTFSNNLSTFSSIFFDKPLARISTRNSAVRHLPVAIIMVSNRTCLQGVLLKEPLLANHVHGAMEKEWSDYEELCLSPRISMCEDTQWKKKGNHLSILCLWGEEFSH